MKKWIISWCCWLLLQSATAQLYFEDKAADWGIDHTYISPRLGGGVSCYDFDGDGWDDLTLATSGGETIHFYKNMGGSFERLPNLVDNEDEAKQILWVDFDNDGDQDLFVASFTGLNRLYEQTEPLVFSDITLTAGLPSFNSNTYGACFGDYDRDGWVDLYFGLRLTANEGGNQHLLFRNNGNGTFSNTTSEANASDPGKPQFCSGFLDYNQDGWPDLYTAHDRIANTNTLLENQGDGTFLDQAAASNSDIAIDAMSVTVGDYNNDGFLDIYCTNTSLGSNLLHNNGPNESGQYTFSEKAAQAGVGFYGTGWSASFLDADVDGDLDLYVSGATVGSDVISAAFFSNENDGTYSQPTAGFVGDTTRTYNNAVGDFNQDGHPDIAVINVYPFYTKVWSASAGNNNWLKIKLRGITSNRDGIGSLIECYKDGHYQQRYTQCGQGFMGQHSGTEIIGLGSASRLDSLVITWPSGQVDRYYDISAQQYLVLPEGGEIEAIPPGNPPAAVEILSHLSAVALPQVALYPSPAHSFLRIDQEKLAYTQYRIHNSQGQCVTQGQLPQLQNILDIRALATGAYTLELVQINGQKHSLNWIKI